MGLIENFKRNRAIKSYIQKLPRLLSKDYGKSKTYTPKQIKSTIDRSGLSPIYACYGIALFSEKGLFDEYHQEIDEVCDYDDMHCEIADKHFQGNYDFGISDIDSVSSECGSGFDGGGGSD